MLKKIEKDSEDPKKKQQYIVPADFKYQESRDLFRNPEVITEKSELEKLIKFNKPDEDGLKSFLVNEKGFTE